MTNSLDDFQARVARRKLARMPQPQPKTTHLPLRDDLEVYFLIFGVFYGGAATLFAFYCGQDSVQAKELMYQGDIEFAVLRYLGGYWLYIFWPTVMFSIVYGVAAKGTLADAMRALGLSAVLIFAAVRGLLYFFGA